MNSQLWHNNDELDINYIVMNDSVYLDDDLEVALGYSEIPIQYIVDQAVPPNSEEISANHKRIISFCRNKNIDLKYGTTTLGKFLVDFAKSKKIYVATSPDVAVVGGKGSLGINLLGKNINQIISAGKVLMKNISSITINLIVDEVIEDREIALQILKEKREKIIGNIVYLVDINHNIPEQSRCYICGWLARFGALSTVFIDQAENVVDEIRIENKKLLMLPGVEHSIDDEKYFGEQIINAVFIGGTYGGRLKDIKKVTTLLKNQCIKKHVRFTVAPDSTKSYIAAIEAGYIETILSSGGMVLNQCALPPAQARLGDKEIMISSDVINDDGYAGGKDAHIYLGSVKLAVESAI